jgi:N-acyl-phosphatidylethanolamine-hydrolysing phospholipase D
MTLHHRIRTPLFLFFILHSSFYFGGCNPIIGRFFSRSVELISRPIDTVSQKIAHPIVPTVGLSVLWVGHATCLIQIGDKVFLTDPAFTSSIGMIAKRWIEAGLDPYAIDRLDIVLISHVHFDHLSYGSLEMLPKSAYLLMPTGASAFLPELGFSDYHELSAWQEIEKDGVKITAVPVKHFNGRYGFDAGWSEFDTFTGYVIEYQGKTVFFAGDTGYDPEKFKEIGKRFTIDLALIPIAPVEPRDFMKRVHTDPAEALQVFDDVKAKIMIPIHHRTFMQGLDSSMTYARDNLVQLAFHRGMNERVLPLNIGEQRILIP